jgi:hypothetical protein
MTGSEVGSEVGSGISSSNPYGYNQATGTFTLTMNEMISLLMSGGLPSGLPAPGIAPNLGSDATGGPSASAGGPSASTGGPSASVGGPSASTGGPSASTGGPSASAGGSSASAADGIIHEINPANALSTVLPQTNLGIPQTLLPNIFSLLGVPRLVPLVNINPQLLNEEVDKILAKGQEKMLTVSPQVMEFIERCFLENVGYDDDVTTLIRFTIRRCFNRGHEFQVEEIVGGIMYYALSEQNYYFSNGYDTVIEMLNSELRRIVTRSLTMRQMTNGHNMEDVKLVVNQEILEKIPVEKFGDISEKIKSMNTACTICQEDFTKEDKARILPCEHIYHPDCIDDWLKEHSYKCPCCRKPAGEHSAKI